MATRSDVWQFYAKAENKATCMLCEKELSYRGGTSNLRDHLNRIHPSQYHPPKREQTTLDHFSTRAAACSEGRARRITELIVNMVALDIRPMRFVECDGFRQLLAFVEPGYRPPSAMYISSLVKKQHLQLKNKLKEKLSEVPSLSLTSDIWSSRANEAYITASCHYISSEWKLESYVLCTKGFPEQHTAINISKEMLGITASFDIKDEQVVAIVHDQGANYELASQMLEEDHGWKNLKCAAHCLQLSVKSGVSISLIERMIAVARKIVGHFRHSITASEALKERQEQMQVAVKRLQQDVATRWNSTLFMLQSLLHSRWPISAVLSDSAKYRYLDMKPEQWELAEKLIEVLLPLQVATTFLSAEFNVSCSCVIPVLFGLIQSLEVSETDGSVIRQFKIKVVSDIKRRWSLDSLDPSNHLVLASALDPRFKQLKFLNDDLRGDVKTELLQRMENLPTIVTSMDESDCPPAKKPKETALDILLGPEDDPDQETTSFFDELQGYEASKIPSRDTDPLVWWKNNMYNYPNLAKIARSVLSIPATSTPAERIFSKSGLIVNNLRSCLKCDSVDALVFLNKNLPSLS